MPWLQAWENLDLLQSFKENIVCIDWWNILLVVISEMLMGTLMKQFWDGCGIKNQCVSDDIQSPLAMVGTEEKKLHLEKQASHRIAHKSTAWNVGTNYTRKSKSYSTPAHQHTETHVNNLEREGILAQTFGLFQFQRHQFSPGEKRYAQAWFIKYTDSGWFLTQWD